MRFVHTAAALILFVTAVSFPAKLTAAQLPGGFVYLSRFDPTIIQEIRYATTKNFVGKVLDGYGALECILARPVAAALSRVQLELAKSGNTLVVFDCYRPQRAVRMMVDVLQRIHDPDPAYYPLINGKDLVKYGYVASRSGHSSGGSVDLTIAERREDLYRKLDMGTRFDFFDPKSHTKTGDVDPAQKKNRTRLQLLMRKHGFSGYDKEWWHFRYLNEPFRGRHFDFPITSPD